MNWRELKPGDVLLWRGASPDLVVSYNVIYIDLLDLENGDVRTQRHRSCAMPIPVLRGEDVILTDEELWLP